MEYEKCVEKYNKWTERRRVRDFLNGLHSKFENRRATLYGTGKLPSLEQAISAIISEETRLRLEAGAAVLEGVVHRRSALLTAESGNYPITGTNTYSRACFECGLTGHLRAACPQLMGGGRGRGLDWRARGRGRGFDGCGGGRGRGMRPAGRANTSVVVEEAPRTVSIEMTTDELEKWHQFKGLSLGDKQSSEPSPSSASAN
uniref:CCHC-type domain-containing protein n=1 Tax=Triticum urartu TaxID=4572 RepID=A0A8R7R3P9_TRIUA